MKKFSIRNTIRLITLILTDFSIMMLSLYLAFWIVGNFSLSLFSADVNMLKYSFLFSAAGILVFIAGGVYNIFLRHMGLREVIVLFSVISITNILPIIIKNTTNFDIPLNVLFLNYAIQLVAIILVRMAYRFFVHFVIIRRKEKTEGGTNEFKRVLVIGAGDAARILITEMMNNGKMGKPCCIVDDAPIFVGRNIQGVKIVGNTKEIPDIVKSQKIDVIIFAIPSASSETRKRIFEICKQTDCMLKTMPSIYQMVDDNNLSSQLRNVEVEDLLGRDPVKIDMKAVADWIKEKTVIVTGGGGSIGSELCRQIARYSPKKLVILDVYENNAYEIEQELLVSNPELDFDTVIASVRETDRMDKIFEEYKPDIVIHAAAHKHVPLMEFSPNEAIKNNVFGTYKTAMSAIKHKVDKFVLISTDKAVNPTNIMGASKRLCEMIVQGLSGTSNTKFAAVRFGNVLGSNGSVIPLFKKQIEKGGPVTVTHPDIIRYFMTIPEAVSLVLEAGADAKDGEIHVLDMGEPVKIDDLARNLIKLSGLRPDIDINIEYTGLRPGEKLYEEMLMSEEGLRRTDNKLIYIGNPIEMNRAEFFEQLKELKKVCYENSPDIKLFVSKMVKTYKYPNSEN